ncbi:MAG: patatin-like phospholipase family protein, partial [Flavobacteriaceae bacterium]
MDRIIIYFMISVYNFLRKHLLLIALSFLFSNPIFAQDKEPKVAVVLSGGGAKGIAHIAVLKKLDSLNIVPDLIVGTSMGSVVGGLYASGYSADSIQKITERIDWDVLLSGNIDLRNVSVEEKSEFNRYLVDLDLIDYKPKVKTSIINDQNLVELLTALTYPVNEIKDFNDLPIPFKAVTTDLVNGKELVVNQGSLVKAIRASMSIPSVFEPVTYNNTLLIDGGVLNNFPVDVAKAWGADIIIGSDVGGGLKPIEELDNVSNILFQTAMLNSSLKIPSHRALCDVLIDHTEVLTYETQDFVHSKDILKQGELATKKSLDAIVALSKQLNTSKQKPRLPFKPMISLDTINYFNISEENIDLIKARMNLTTNEMYDTNGINTAVDRALGTQLFHKINYEFKNDSEKLELHITGEEKYKHQLSTALHYDTYQKIGILFNYTARNLFDKSSRLIIGVDIAEQPKFRIEYQKNFGKEKSMWWRVQVFGQQTKQKYYGNGYLGEILNQNYAKTKIEINKNISPLKSYLGIDLNFETFKSTPELDTDLNNNVYNLNLYYSNNLELSTYFYYNTLNKPFFATKGSSMEVRFSRALRNKVNVEYVEESTNNKLGLTNLYSRITGQLENRKQLNKFVTFISQLDFGFTFVDSNKGNNTNKIDFLRHGQGAKFALGGFLNQNQRNGYKFKGLGDSQLLTTQFIKAHFNYQYEISRNIFLTPHINFGLVGFGKFDDFLNEIKLSNSNWSNLETSSLMFTSGITAAYNSILGPVFFDLSYINDLNKWPL